MPALPLTPAERRAHRAAAHHLHPVVAIGAEGLTPAVLKETDAALRAHGLVKLRVRNAVTQLNAVFNDMFSRADQGVASPRVETGFLGDAEDEIDRLFGA